MRKRLTLPCPFRKTACTLPNLNLVPSRVQKEMHADIGAPHCASLDHEGPPEVSPRARTRRLRKGRRLHEYLQPGSLFRHGREGSKRSDTDRLFHLVLAALDSSDPRVRVAAVEIDLLANNLMKSPQGLGKLLNQIHNDPEG